MKLILSIPSKTFIAGEYLALKQKPCLLVSTEPRFELLVEKSDSQYGQESLFHRESPAGIFYEKEKIFFRQFKLRFNDPHDGAGGFGASSAQFIGLNILTQLGDNIWSDLQLEFDFKKVFFEYKNIVQKKNGNSPSGADVMAQLTGGICYFDAEHSVVKKLKWPFENIGFKVIATGNKISTHSHLASLQIENWINLDKVNSEICLSIMNADENGFSESISKFYDELKSENLVSIETVNFINLIRQQAGVLTAKGCGALGADAVFVLFNKKEINEDFFSKFVKNHSKKIIATEEHISQGVIKRVC